MQDLPGQTIFPFFTPQPTWPSYIKQGAKIWDIFNKVGASITEITERGFVFRYDEPISFGRMGEKSIGGIVYENGFSSFCSIGLMETLSVPIDDWLEKNPYEFMNFFKSHK